jgi:uncharacterized protein
MVDEVVTRLFDWDKGNRAHCQQHGVSIAEIEALWRGEPGIAPDPKHVHLEDRLIVVGRIARGRPLFVAFTIRERFGQPTIRPVSARYLHEKEVRNYEAQGPQNDHLTSKQKPFLSRTCPIWIFRSSNR